MTPDEETRFLFLLFVFGVENLFCYMSSKVSSWVGPAGEADEVENQTSDLCQVWGCDEVQCQQS